MKVLCMKRIVAFIISLYENITLQKKVRIHVLIIGTPRYLAHVTTKCHLQVPSDGNTHTAS